MIGAELSSGIISPYSRDRAVYSRSRNGLTVIEILIVVGIIGVMSMAMVPTAEIMVIRLKESEFETNLTSIRNAIQLWQRDCRQAVLKQLSRVDRNSLPDCYLYPPDIGSLAKTPDPANPYEFIYNGNTIRFYPRQYLPRIPADPFVGRALWAQHYASGTSVTTWDMGVVTPAVDIGTGVFDVSGHPDPVVRRGFVQAVDGSEYKDW